MALSMGEVPPLDPDEILLRRIPPSRPENKTVDVDADGTERAARNVMSPRKSRKTGEFEQGLSCSRLRLTSPRELLAALGDRDPSGW
ncbi:MAG: hypothetical protein ACK5Q5_15925 [Planctomycetaceae bacterium]